MLDPSPSGKFVDARTLAATLGLSLGQVYRLSASGRIPKYKAGHRTIRFDLEEVRTALRAYAAPPLAPPERRSVVSPTASPPARDLPSYNWNTTAPAGATLRLADRRG